MPLMTPAAALDKIARVARAGCGDDPAAAQKALRYIAEAAAGSATRAEKRDDAEAAAALKTHLDVIETNLLLAALARRAKGLVVITLAEPTPGEESYGIYGHGGTILNRGMLEWGRQYLAACQDPIAAINNARRRA